MHRPSFLSHAVPRGRAVAPCTVEPHGTFLGTTGARDGRALEASLP